MILPFTLKFYLLFAGCLSAFILTYAGGSYIYKLHKEASRGREAKVLKEDFTFCNKKALNKLEKAECYIIFLKNLDKVIEEDKK